MLTASEKKYILDSMSDLLDDYDYEYDESALDDIIDEWYSQKEPLIKAFKRHPNYIEGKFMIAFDADYDRPIDKNESARFANFILRNAPEFKETLPEEVKENTYDWEYLQDEIYTFFARLDRYAERVISSETAEYLNRYVPAIHAHAGQKTSRVVNKLCNYLGYDNMPDYNKAFAKYADSLSPLTIKRHTILSLSPLDYLTMSFGNSWASCHTIDKKNRRGMPNAYHGQYSSGTVSYMLDPSSIVFYTVDAEYNGDDYWTQPKINRQMFHWGEDKLVQGRLYPQNNDCGSNGVYTQYRNIVQKIVSEIFEFPNLWTLRKGNDEASRYIVSYGTHYRDYNHYGNCTLSIIKGSENNKCFSVGADPICIYCGNRHHDSESISCCNRTYCEDCGCVIEDEDDAIQIDGHTYCRNCCNWCDRCGEYHRMEEYWIESEDQYVCEYCFDSYYERCEECGENHRRSRMTYVESEGIWVCGDCLDDYFTCCAECGNYFRNGDVIYDEDACECFCEECHKSRKERENEEEEEVV